MDETPEITALQTTRPTGTMLHKRRAKPRGTRSRFREAYERYFGNITMSCKVAGIARKTYYRWMESNSRVNRKFQAQIRRIKPLERFKDIA